MDMTRELHDFLLTIQPEGASHEVRTCSFCTETASAKEREVADFSQEQHEQLLEAAVLKATEEVTATAAAEHDASILDLNQKLEAANQALAERDTEIEGLKSTISDRDEADRLAKLADERVEQVQEVATFTEEQLEERAPRWAAMDEQTFEGVLADYKAVATAAAAKPNGERKTAFDGTRATAGEEGTEESALGDFFGSGLHAAT
jgi:hypothetical protein